jgi:hypothetical protein
LLVSLPRGYPESASPQLQLLSRYIGAFGVDASLFGAVLRTFIIHDGGAIWESGSVCVFDGVQAVLERCSRWYEDRLSAEQAGELLREESKDAAQGPAEGSRHNKDDVESLTAQETLPAMPEGVAIIVAEPIVDRKSSFVGRACSISDPAQVIRIIQELLPILTRPAIQVPAILAHLMSDRRISRAAHPVINAWRCTKNGVVHQDNDDDGETAAGGRIAHLLQILVRSLVFRLIYHIELFLGCK